MNSKSAKAILHSGAVPPQNETILFFPLGDTQRPPLKVVGEDTLGRRRYLGDEEIKATIKDTVKAIMKESC